jgi:uncharacterized delta-60 repeat protein
VHGAGRRPVCALLGSGFMGTHRHSSNDRDRDNRLNGGASPWRAGALSIWAALFLLCACGHDSGHTPGIGDSRDAGAEDAGARSEASIGAEGGTISAPDGASVEIPAGALSSDVEIGIARSSSGAPPLPDGFTVYGSIHALTPHGTQFAAPVTVTLPYDASSVPDGGEPSLYKTNAARTWERVPDAVFEGDHVTARVTGFSWFVPGDPGLLRELPIRNYEFRLSTDDGKMTPQPTRPVVIGGELKEEFDLGENNVFDVDHDGTTSLEVYSGSDGRDFWASADAPHGNPDPGSVVMGEAELDQQQSFVKVAKDASLQFIITKAFLEAVDFNGDALPSECPAGFNSLSAVLTGACDMLRAQLDFTLRAYDDHGDLMNANQHPVLRTGGYAVLSGHSGGWFFGTGISATVSGLNRYLWHKEDFEFSQDRDGSSGRQHPRAALAHSITLDVDLSLVKLNQEFTVASILTASAYNKRGRESGIGAYLRDPSKLEGATIKTTGLVATNRPLPLPTEVPVVLSQCASGSDPSAGVLELGAANYALAEQPLAGRTEIQITRNGGSTGDVSVTFSTGGGDAVPGKHYTPVTTTVVFPDGDTSPRTVPIEILLDAESEPDRTVSLALSNPGGCAKLGARSTAVLTILDDDRVVPSEGFTVGGTISGLEGKGLVLTSLGSDLAVSSDGAFSFPDTAPDGASYDVRVKSEPRDPDQVCVVEGGRGNVGGANVTNIHVTCTTVAVDPGLDPGFGVAGIVSTPFGGGPSAMVLQPDGKIVMVGGETVDFSLARYLVDGTLDTSFGSGGLVTTDLGGGSEDEAHAVALQTDGKLVVAGYTVTGRTKNNQSNYDFAVLRYDTDGSLDASFGTGGKVTTDFAGSTDEAAGVIVQPDGRIIVVGQSSFVNADGLTGGTDFAVARYLPDGSLDADFGSGGKLTTDIAGAGDFAENVALQKDGAIVVSGRVGTPGDSSADHTGVTRYSAGGELDASFGTAGKVLVKNLEVGEGLALQNDGMLLMTGTSRTGGTARFATMRLAANGGVDAGFGTNGLVTTAFSTGDDGARAVTVQSDGKILVAGQSGILSNADFAIARYGADGKLDPTFGTGGKLGHDFFGGFDGAESIALQPDGKIVVGGFAANGSRGGYALLRTAK